MRLLDANVLLYAYNADSPHHIAARAWLEEAFNAEEPIGLPWQSILAFVRITTNPRAVRRPLTGMQACDIVNEWLARPNITAIDAGERFSALFREYVAEAKLSGPLVIDAALAVLTSEQRGDPLFDG
jgi:uncharacterized protein